MHNNSRFSGFFYKQRIASELDLGFYINGLTTSLVTLDSYNTTVLYCFSWYCASCSVNPLCNYLELDSNHCTICVTYIVTLFTYQSGT